MSLFSKTNPDSNSELLYGWSEELGSFYQIRNLDLPEDSPKFVMESKSFLSDNLSKDELASIFDKWDVPREHILAVILGEEF